ncbi:MAG: hypothetical protein KA368_16080 [Acidobacteria bacterium]|nr:hypothetical protein [Acidobacteriota bacterium]
MTHRKPNNFLQPRPPTLRVDSSHAQRQSADAIILPIVYELAEPNRGCFKSDSVIVPITWPLRRVVTTTIIPLGIPGKFPDRKKKLALLKQKVELRRERAAKAKALRAKQAEVISPQSENEPAGKAGCSPTAVPLLLLSAIVLVVFAWACFR